MYLACRTDAMPKWWGRAITQMEIAELSSPEELACAKMDCPYRETGCPYEMEGCEQVWEMVATA